MFGEEIGADDAREVGGAHGVDFAGLGDEFEIVQRLLKQEEIGGGKGGGEDGLKPLQERAGVFWGHGRGSRERRSRSQPLGSADVEETRLDQRQRVLQTHCQIDL